MKKIFKIFDILKRAQFILTKPQRKKIVIFDSRSEIYISDFFEKDEYSTLDTSYKVINIYIIFKLIFSLKKINYVNYFSMLIKLINPKFVFTFVDNNLSFYKIKKNFNQIKFISIQNGTRFITGDILEELEKPEIKLEEYYVDHYFTFNRCYANIIRKFIKGNYKIIGSCKNNFFKVSKDFQKDSLCYISRMSDIFLDASQCTNYEKLKKKYKFWEIELVEFVKILLKNVNIFCKKNNIRLNIIGSSPNPELEKKFFESIFFEKNFNFFPKKKLYDSYRIIDNFEVCINPMSTFGYEALAREKKVAFFSGDFIKGSDFCWPLDLSKKGKFYTNSNSIDEVERILKYLFNVNEENWLKEINKYRDKIFYYDEGNKIIKSFLTENKITKKWR